MSQVKLAFRNLSGHAFRSWVVALCALLIASFALLATLVLRGAQASLRLAQERLGADILVVPEGTVERVENALLMGITDRVWMPQENLEKIAAVPGVQMASPQIYLSTLTGASCCSVEDMFLIAFDPATDFTLRPWLEKNMGGELPFGDVLGGMYVFTPEGEQNISIYGYLVTLVGNMEPTGTGLDQTMFMTMETAKDIARLSYTLAEKPLEIPPDSISAVLVRLQPGADSQGVATEIGNSVEGVTPIPSTEMFRSFHEQISLMMRILLVMMAITLLLSLILIAVIFSIAVNERRREMGVLRAMGAGRGYVLQTLLAEAAILSAIGGLTGALLTTLAVALFRNLIMMALGIPFLMPAPFLLVAQVLIGLGFALLGIGFACLLPAYRVSYMEPALAMRE